MSVEPTVGRVALAAVQGLVVVAVLLAAWGAQVASAAGAAAPITVLAPDTLIVRANQAQTTTVSVRNDSAEAVPLDLSIVLDEGSASVTPTRVTVPGYHVVPLKLTISTGTSGNKSGSLLLTAADSAPATVPLVIQGETSSSAVVALILSPLLVAFILIGIAFVAAHKTGKIDQPFGPANLDFSQSWGTSLTLVGALLGTVLSAGVLPDRLSLFSGAGYAGFNVLFGMLVLVAPLVFAATEKWQQVTDGDDPQYAGPMWGFLLASIVTAWGVGGELATVGLLFREIERAGNLSTWLVLGLYVVLFAISGVAAFYVYRRTRMILEAPREATAPNAVRSATRTAHGPSPWPLL